MASFLLRLAKQWIAGEDAASGIERVREANSRGILGLLNLLGEHVKTREEVQRTVDEYSKLLDLIQEKGVQSQISIKPTQMGMNIDFDFCLSNYLLIADRCQAHDNNWLWIDMENSPFTQKTIDLYVRVLEKYQNTGIAIQSYMKRSESDLRRILPLDAKVRLVKGAYNESPEIVYKDKEQIRSNFALLLGMLFAQENFFAVATHDSKLVNVSKELAAKNKNAKFEFEMLMGVRDNLKAQLVSENYQVREYVPYGPQWLPYSIRRIREKKSNLLLLLRSLFSR